MKRRTFLRLSSYLAALPLSMGLTACGSSSSASSRPVSSSTASSVDQLVDDVDETYVEHGMTLEEAQALSENNYWEKVFILRNEKFYTLPDPCRMIYDEFFSYKNDSDYSYGAVFDEQSFRKSVFWDDPDADNTTLYKDDKLVYVSADTIPDTFDFALVGYSGYTLPLIFKQDYDTGTPLGIEAVHGHFADYDPSYVPPTDTTSFSLNASLDVQINGQPLEEYIASHQLIPIDYYSNPMIAKNANCVVDLSDYATLNDSALENGMFTLDEKNSENVATVSFYSGTGYYEFTVEATCLFYLYDKPYSISCNVTKTKEGYAIIDTSALASRGNFLNYVLIHPKTSSHEYRPLSVLTIET